MASKTKTLLANRILQHSNNCDAIRARTCFTPEDYRTAARMLDESLASIAELERVWEALYGEIPSSLEIHQAAQA